MTAPDRRVDPLSYLTKEAHNLGAVARGLMGGYSPQPKPAGPGQTAAYGGGGAAAGAAQAQPPQGGGGALGRFAGTLGGAARGFGRALGFGGSPSYGQMAQGAATAGAQGAAQGGAQGGALGQPQQSSFGGMLGNAWNQMRGFFGGGGQQPPQQQTRPQAQQPQQSGFENWIAGAAARQANAQPQAQQPRNNQQAGAGLPPQRSNQQLGGVDPRSAQARRMVRTAADLYPLGGVARPEKEGGDAAPACPFAAGPAATAFSREKAAAPNWRAMGQGVAGFFGRGGRAAGTAAHGLQQAATPSLGQRARTFAGSFVRQGENNTLRNMSRWQHAAQLPGMAGGAFLGNMTGEDLGLPGGFEGPLGIRVNPAGMLAGAAMGHRGVRQTSFGRTLMRPAIQSGAGSLAGSLGDTLAGVAGYDTGGSMGRLGAWGGLGLGLGGNRFLNQRDALNATVRRRLAMVGNDPNRRAMVLGGARRAMGQLTNSPVHQANQFLDHTLQGAMDPFRAVGRGARRFFTGEAPQVGGMSHRGFGRVAPARPAPGVQTFGRRVGQLATAVPLGMTAAGLGYNALTGRLRDDMNENIARAYGALREQGMSDMDDYLTQRGVLDGQGRFNPMQGVGHGLQQMANPFLQMLGFHNPQQMSGGQRLAGMAGPAMAGMGLMSGNPAMTGAGAAMYAYPHFARQGQQPGLPFHPGAQGGPGFTGLDRNEFAHQTTPRQQAHPFSSQQPTGQGYL